MENGPGNIIDMREWKGRKAQELFGEVATEIRRGTLQIHLADVFSLFAKTDEILHYALEGQKLDPNTPDYQTRCAKAKNEILKNVDAIAQVLPQYPDADCQAVRESLNLLKDFAEQIKD